MKRKILIAANISVAIASASLYGYGKFREHQIHQAHEREIQQIVSHYQSCPDMYRAHRECQSEEERRRLVSEADEHERAGRFEQAGMIFVDLGLEFEGRAREMAGRCDSAGRARILRALDLNIEAARRVH